MIVAGGAFAMGGWGDALLSVAALPYAAASAYLASLAASVRIVPPRAASSGSTTRFAVVIPAHDEEEGIARTVESIAALDYPIAARRVVVVADNCTDRTAERARAAGAQVLERVDPDRRGKGYALTFAFEHLVAEGWADAVVVVDADTSVSPNLLVACEAGLARGLDALQAHYDVRDPDQSWRTRLASLAFALFHGVRSSARERWEVSCGLRGNGMCFRTSLLQRVPHAAYSVVEDLEYGIALGLAGVRVGYLDDAWVRGDMPANARDSRSQRARWEGGRRAIVKQYAGRLVAEGIARRSLLLLDLAADLLVPPLSSLALAIALGTSAALALALLQQALTIAALLWGGTAIGLAVYVLRGCQMTGHFGRALGDLAWAPIFILWKLTVRATGGNRRNEWVRTTRTTLR